MQYNLVQFTHNFALRKVLRNCVTQIKYSSIFELLGKQYIVIKSAERLITTDGAILCMKLNKLEKTLHKWAESEVDQTIEFIKFEHNSVLGDNGRLLNIDGNTITRIFNYFTDFFAILNYTEDSFSDAASGCG